MLSAYITHPDCARHEMGAHHPECPERLSAINDHLLVKGLLDYMVPYDAPLATEEQLGRPTPRCTCANSWRWRPPKARTRWTRTPA